MKEKIAKKIACMAKKKAYESVGKRDRKSVV